MTTKHVHRPKTSGTMPFTGPIRGAQHNPVAHGNVCIVDVCRCGAVRRTNSNAGVKERGPWEVTA